MHFESTDLKKKDLKLFIRSNYKMMMKFLSNLAFNNL